MVQVLKMNSYLKAPSVILAVLWLYIGNVKCDRNRSAGCKISLPQDIPENEPLYLLERRQRYDFFKPDNKINYIPNNSVIDLHCSGKRNSLNTSRSAGRSQNQTRLECKDNNFVNENNSFVQIKTFQCNKRSSAELKITRERCASNRGYIYDVGFEVKLRNFITVFKICYNNQTEHMFYTVHEINGKGIKYSIKENKRKEFKSTGMSSGNSRTIQRVYNKNNQIQRFHALFGANQNYINNTVFLARGHLTPDADFIFPNAQLATYFYVNVAPEFQIINSGNWKRVENLARDLATSYETNLEIYTGIHDTLSLPNERGNLIPIFLDDDEKIEVPKWFWKVIRNPKNNASIALITLNNPFTELHQIIEFCPNVCGRASLNSKHFTNIRKGYTYCCEIDTFQKVVDDLPLSFYSSQLLNCFNANLSLD